MAELKNEDLQKFSDLKKSAKPRKSPLQRKIEKRAAMKKVRDADVFRLCEKSISLENIAEELGISTMAVARYIERLLRRGKPVSIETYVSSRKQHEIEEAFFEVQSSSIKRIAAVLKGKATTEEIRIVRGLLHYRYKSGSDGEYR